MNKIIVLDVFILLHTIVCICKNHLNQDAVATE